MLCAVLLALSAAAKAPAQSQQPPQSKCPLAAAKSEQHEDLRTNPQNATDGNQPQSETPPTVRENTAYFEDAPRHEQHESSWAKTLPWITAGLTFLMVVGTLSMAYATFRLAQNANTQVGLLSKYVRATDKMAEATADAAHATRNMAGAATDSVHVAKTSLHELERPWVLIEPGDMRNPEDPHWDGRPPFHVFLHWEIQNAGRTPAWPVRTSAKIEAMSALDLAGSPQYEEPPSDFRTKPIGPDQGAPGYECRGFFEEGKLREIQHGERFLFFFGFVDYTDIFGAMHTTKFCFVMQNRIPPAGALKHPTDWSIAGDSRWNSYS